MKNNRLKKFISGFLILVLTAGFTFSGEMILDREESTALAAKTIDGLKDDLGDIEDQKDKVQSELQTVAENIRKLNNSVDYIEGQVSQTLDKISRTETKIKRKQKQILEQEENLNARLVVMYKNGSIGFVDVLLGSGSISEFVSNLELIKKIYENDIEVLKNLQKEQAELEVIKNDLELKKKELAEKQKELAAEKEKLNAEKKKLEKEEDKLKEEADALTAKIKEMIDAQSRYIGGEFLWPCPSSHYITSSFGGRIHPILKVWKMHTGTDIGASYGADILAAATGKVIMSQYYGGYGYCVMIDHGGGVVTLYGHCSSLLVSVGQQVNRGAVIARVGSTGSSTGNHLHFEVRKNGEYIDPMQYF